jgi:hypothetical protein
MGKVLRCSNKDCDSHKDDEHLFSINCTVDGDRCLAGPLARVAPRYFECCFCGDIAEEREEA